MPSAQAGDWIDVSREEESGSGLIVLAVLETAQTA